MKKNRKYKKIKIIMVFTTVLLIAFVAVVGLYKTGIYRFDFFKDVYKKIDFQLSTNELNIPQDALSFSVYDIEQGEYLFYEGDSQLPTVASLAKLFVIDYALTKVNLEDVIEVNQEVLDSCAGWVIFSKSKSWEVHSKRNNGSYACSFGKRCCLFVGILYC